MSSLPAAPSQGFLCATQVNAPLSLFTALGLIGCKSSFVFSISHDLGILSWLGFSRACGEQGSLLLNGLLEPSTHSPGHAGSGRAGSLLLGDTQLQFMNQQSWAGREGSEAGERLHPLLQDFSYQLSKWFLCLHPQTDSSSPPALLKEAPQKPIAWLLPYLVRLFWGAGQI